MQTKKRKEKAKIYQKDNSCTKKEGHTMSNEKQESKKQKENEKSLKKTNEKENESKPQARKD